LANSPVPKDLAIQPLIWGDAAQQLTHGPLPAITLAAPFIIIHADNYFEGPLSQPWIYQTSAEFIVTLSRLTDACNRCPFPTELIIRVKPNFKAKGKARWMKPV
jgi:hypothetical protein